MNTRNPFAVSAPGSAPWNVRRGSHPGGMIHGSTPGRADRVPTKVPNGSFVIPADTVSALGQGNSVAGGEILASMFKSGPYGSAARQQFQGRRGLRRADGGDVKADDDAPVDIAASDGEFILDPETVREIGNGDLNAGHRVLHAFVLRVRREHVKTLRGLKDPKV